MGLCAALRAEAEPLTAELRRLHVTVTRQFLKKVASARDGLSHAIPGATTEQVLEAAIDLLLEKQARRRGQVTRPRKTAPEPAASAEETAKLAFGRRCVERYSRAAGRRPDRHAHPGPH